MNDALPAGEMAPPVHQSGLQWMLSVLGFDIALLLVAAAIAFAVVLVMLHRGKGPAMVGAILLVIPLPLYFALWRALGGVVVSGSAIAVAETAPKPHEVFGGIAEMALFMRMGLMLTIPSFLLATIGLAVRALQVESAPAAALASSGKPLD
jgi:hypothetical protein